MPDGSQIAGVGVFTVPEAARLTRLPAAQIRRWVFGYRSRPSVLSPELSAQDGQDALGFLNLIEVLFLRDLRLQGVQWTTIRRAADLARRHLKETHPFATKLFHTDGRSIFLEVAGETGDPSLIDLLDGNGAMLAVLEQSFVRSLRFDGLNGRADEWQPDQALNRVVVDPARRFGQPIDRDCGVPTEVLANAFRAEGDAERVARWWKVPVEAVRQAAEFEVRLGLRRRPA